ncbi:MAG: CocE/NonD family hydrolase [Clostridia bacterium]|nr:CocE/NonD family hydrolase [Clostridia bacterium]
MENHFCYAEYLDNGGVKLFTVVCLPEREGKFPTVIQRTPYVDADENAADDEIIEKKHNDFKPWLDAGYAVVFQHCRGRGKSGGDCIPYIYEREDGLFFQDWVRKQSFYNGEIFLRGGSYTSSVHFVTAPFADDIKGAVLEVQDCERYNGIYRNGFFKIALHGGWYVGMYKAKSHLKKNYTPESFNILPLSDFSKTVFGESSEDLDETFRHPDKNDPFWSTHAGGVESRGAIKHADIPILLVTGFYDIYTGGVFDMWNALDDSTKAKSALAVHPFDHGCNGKGQPIDFEGGNLTETFGHYSIKWCDHVRKGTKAPFEPGKVTYFKLFGEGWRCDAFNDAEKKITVPLGEGEVSYVYDPDDPAVFKGGLSQNFGGNAWQDDHSDRRDVISVFSPVFTEDVFVKGKMTARLKVASDCPDTCFYVRVNLCKPEGVYGLRDDITQLSNFDADYTPGDRIGISFSFDEHAFVIKKGERLRIDISSSAFPLFVRHTNNRGLFSEQTAARKALNTVVLSDSLLELPVK